MSQTLRETTAAPVSQLRWFMTGYSCWYFAYGMNSVLFPWLIAVWLDQSASRVGLAMTVSMIPTMLLIMFGGVVADRNDARALILRYDLLTMLPGATMAVLFLLDVVSYGLLLAYAVVLAGLFAFNAPARDSLLNRVAGDQLQKAVAKVGIAQFGAQLAGIALAGIAATVGVIPLLLIHAGANFLAFLADRNLAPAPKPKSGNGQGKFLDLIEAFAAACRAPEVWPVLLIMFGVGVCYVGAFMVLLPLLVKEYGGSSAEMSMTFFAFFAGTILANLLLARIGHIARPGRIYLLSTGTGIVILCLLGWQDNLPTLVGLCFLWGFGAGFNMTLSRSMLLTFAPDHLRARFMALLSFAMLGGGPIGAYLIGLWAERVGAHDAVYPPAAAMVALLLVMLLVSRLWQVHIRRGA